MPRGPRKLSSPPALSLPFISLAMNNFRPTQDWRAVMVNLLSLKQE
jgi:hypothetical protein